MSRVVTNTGTLEVYPSSYIDKAVDGSWYSIANAANAYMGYNQGTSSYCMVNLTRGAGAETHIYFKFDTSTIPENATIDSISCIVRLYMSSINVANVATKSAVMCSGTTEKTESVTISNSAANRTFSMGTWTRQEVNDVRLKLSATRGTSNTSTNYNFRLCGATLTIGYTYENHYYEITTGSSVPGVTISSSDNEVEEGGDATITISGGAPSSDFNLSDNDVNVTGDVVASGSSYEYYLTNIQSDHTVLAIIPTTTGQSLFVKQNGSWTPVDAIYVKQNGSWKKVDTLSIKQNGSWIN